MEDFVDSIKFVWWQGVVEDRDDPLQLGRCRVRILGFHPQEKAAVDTKELPWAFPLQDITSAAMSGIGHAPVGPVEGTWVIGFFRDGENAQEPVMIGTIGGIPQEGPQRGLGFYDPNGKYPLRDRDLEIDTDPELSPLQGTFTQHGLDEPDTNRLARTDGSSILGADSDVHPVTLQKLTDLKIPNFPGVPHETAPITTASSPNTWDEPFTQANEAKYPFNHVFESESGHIQEFDDTEGSERVHRFHKVGTFEEWYANGDSMRKVVGNNYEIVLGDDDLLVKGDLNITTQQNARIKINNQLDIDVVEGDIRIVVRQGNLDLQVQQGNANVLVQGNLTSVVNGNKDETIGGNYNLQVGGNYRVNAGQVTIRAGTIFLN